MRLFNPFQWAVDATQKRSVWWCGYLAKFALLSVLLMPLLRTRSFTGEDAKWLAVAVFGVLALWAEARSEAKLAEHRTLYLIGAWLVWPLMVLSLPMFFWASSGEGAAIVLHGVAFASFCSFALCHPPAPPKHKHSFSLQKGRA